jgi:hypothetical protein
VKIYYDTEFLEDGETIALISIGMVAEDGREYYAVNAEMPVRRIRKSQWLMDNVVRGLPQFHGDERNHHSPKMLFNPYDPAVKPKSVIATEVRDFILAAGPDVELWAWYAAYDHVALAQLFGRMIDLPDGIPMWTNDLRQEVHRLGNPQMPEQEDGVHNALADARHNLVMARFLEGAAS